MATTPDNKDGKPKRDIEQQMLMREVDEAVRADEAIGAAKKYGVAVAILVAVGLAVFGGYLYWKSSSESELERQSETIVTALDELEAGNLDVADEELAGLSAEGSPGAMASALMIRAGIALQDGRKQDAVTLYDRVANNPDTPRPMRDAAVVRSVAATFDDLDPQQVIDRLGPLATADNPWFGSAGEMVAMAYLAQGREEQAGPLLVEIAQNENVPESLRARTRQMAGMIGFDAIEDPEQMLDQLQGPALEEPASRGASAP